MDEMDWYMIVLILTVLVMAVFFGWIEHIETMAGCVK